jgi:Tol biopolymer transport system component
MSRGTGIKLPTEGVFDRMFPVWTPDGQSLGFTGFNAENSSLDLFLQPANGNAPPKLLGGTPGEDQAGSFTPDGRALIFGTFHSQATGGSAIWRLWLGSKEPPERLSSGRQQERLPRVSPDGRLIAYEGIQADRVEALWAKFPSLGAGAPVSRDGGLNPRWSANGRELMFRRASRFYAAPVPVGPEPSVGEARMLFEAKGISTFDVLPDGSGFVALRALPDSSSQTQLRLITNWFDELRGLVR